MKKIIFSTVAFLLGVVFIAQSFSAERPQRVKPDVSATLAPAAPAVLSIIPAQAEPGARVMIFGSGFGDKISAFLGNTEIPAKVIDGKKMEFIIPSQLEAGIYAFYLKRSDGATGKPYNFTVLPLRPVLTAISPDRINSCAQGKEREVTAQGQNFNTASMLFFDGAGIKSSGTSHESLTFNVPQVAGGIHQVQVKNSPDNASVTMAVTIETRAEINQVTVGTEYVNNYELIITGKNFHQNSSIYVDGQQIGGRGGQDTEREKLIYVDCSKLVYLRYPYSPVNKDFRIQVVNPGGEGSQVVQMNAP